MANSGHDNAGKILNDVQLAGDGFGFDLVTNQICKMIPNGIVDVATVQKQAVISAVRAAALALTIDVLIHRDDPPAVIEPDAPGF
jgi:chaperonin GroEL (HSP60 family)